MNITVTIAPSPELLQSLQTLSNALKGISNHSFPIEIPPVSAMLTASEESAEKPVTIAAKKTKTALNEAAPVVEDKPQTGVKVTIESMREIASIKAKMGKAKGLKALLAEFNTATIALLPDADREAFYQKLIAL